MNVIKPYFFQHFLQSTLQEKKSEEEQFEDKLEEEEKEHKPEGKGEQAHNPFRFLVKRQNEFMFTKMEISGCKKLYCSWVLLCQVFGCS